MQANVYQDANTNCRGGRGLNVQSRVRMGTRFQNIMKTRDIKEKKKKERKKIQMTNTSSQTEEEEEVVNVRGEWLWPLPVSPPLVWILVLKW